MAFSQALIRRWHLDRVPSRLDYPFDILADRPLPETMTTTSYLQELIGTIAGLLTTVAFLPQAIKIWRSKSAKDISLAMFVCFCAGIVLWVIYGFMLGAFPVILANVVTLCIAATILVFKLRYG
jgi:MtN3 and saliva related transmembrane protein